MWQKCPICNGTGKIEVYNLSPNLTSVSTLNHTICPVCNGQRIISELNGLPPRPNFGQELINDNDDFNGKTQEEMLEYFRKRAEDIKKRQKQNEILTNKELTDSLFNIAKDQQHESATD